MSPAMPARAPASAVQGEPRPAPSPPPAIVGSVLARPAPPPAAAATPAAPRAEPAPRRPDRQVIARIPEAAPPGPSPTRPSAVAETEPSPRPSGHGLVSAPAGSLAAMARSQRTYWVQVGAFRSVDAAQRLTQRLTTWAHTIIVGPLTRALAGRDDALARVLIGPFPQRAQASAALRRLQASGIQGFVAEDLR
jgi:hypothetical protein